MGLYKNKSNGKNLFSFDENNKATVPSLEEEILLKNLNQFMHSTAFFYFVDPANYNKNFKLFDQENRAIIEKGYNIAQDISTIIQNAEQVSSSGNYTYLSDKKTDLLKPIYIYICHLKIFLNFVQIILPLELLPFPEPFLEKVRYKIERVLSQSLCMRNRFLWQYRCFLTLKNTSELKVALAAYSKEDELNSKECFVNEVKK